MHKSCIVVRFSIFDNNVLICYFMPYSKLYIIFRNFFKIACLLDSYLNDGEGTKWCMLITIENDLYIFKFYEHLVRNQPSITTTFCANAINQNR